MHAVGFCPKIVLACAVLHPGSSKMGEELVLWENFVQANGRGVGRDMRVVICRGSRQTGASDDTLPKLAAPAALGYTVCHLWKCALSYRLPERSRGGKQPAA